MAFVHEEEEVAFWEEVEEGGGGGVLGAPAEVARVVLQSLAVAL